MLCFEVFLLDLEYLLQLHALSSLKPVELVVELRILSAQPSDHINESSVLLHNVLVLILVAYGGGLLSLHQHLHAVLQITFLSLVLLLDVLVDDGAFYFLVLHKVIQLLVDGLLQLLMVVDVLNDPVDGVFLLVDLVGVLADDGAELGDLVCHRFLLDAEVVDLEAGLRISLVEVFQVVVEVVGLVAQLENLLLFRSDSAIQVLDLVVQHEFELLELLCLLLEPIDFFLTRADELIALADLRVEVVRLLLQVGIDLVLTVDEHALF